MYYSHYGRHYIDNKDIREVVKVLKSSYLTQGPKVQEFESNLADYCGAKYAVTVSNGTAALHMAYIAIGLKEGAEVITTPNTFVATTNMILACGGKPIFCDIRLDTYNINELEIEKYITKKTKCIVPVHFAGQPSEMDAILKIAKKYKIKIIEDGCHALGATYKDKKIGSLKSDMTVFSFHPVKPITTGEGGAIVTNNKQYYKQLLLLRSHGIKKDRNGFNSMQTFGYNYRLTDLQATLGISQLNKLDAFIEKRKKIVLCYSKYLKGVKEIILPVEKENGRSAWHLYVIRVCQPQIRNKLLDYLRKKNIGINLHYPPIYKHRYYQNNNYKNVKLLDQEYYYKTCLTLPCHVNLSLRDIRYISSCINSFFKAQKI